MLSKLATILVMLIHITSCAHSGGTKAEVVNQLALIPRVHFKLDSDQLTPEGRGIIYHNVQWMKENPAEVIILEGHCDERGDADYNMYLGDRRARAVRAELKEYGADDDVIAVVSYGETRPLDKDHNKKSWKMNRRVEFVAR